MKNITKNLAFLLTFFVVTFFSTTSNAQEKKLTGKFTYEGRDINLPPDAFFRPKKFKYIDYSEKLSSPGKHTTTKNFMEGFSKEDIKNFKTKYQDEYAYYLEAIAYFDKLSNKVLSCYSTKELWYIYIYDQPLKNNLLHF